MPWEAGVYSANLICSSKLASADALFEDGIGRPVAKGSAIRPMLLQYGIPRFGVRQRYSGTE